MRGVSGIVALILLIVVVIVGYSCIFTVRQTEQALVVRLGEPVRVVTDPGLHFKAPFVDSVISIDKRILDLENPAQEIIAFDQRRLVVDAFARYRIKNALRFYQSVGSIQAANIQLTTLLNASLRRVLGEVSFIQVVRDEREALMNKIRDQLDKEAGGYGIQVVDVRIRRADLPDKNSEAVYQRMQTERQREAAEFRAQYRRGRLFHMVLHPQHIGWCNRLALLHDFLAQLTGHPGLWNPTNAELARHWRANFGAGTHLRLAPSIWRDYPDSLS